MFNRLVETDWISERFIVLLGRTVDTPSHTGQADHSSSHLPPEENYYANVFKLQLER